jgi:hypothetical protein
MTMLLCLVCLTRLGNLALDGIGLHHVSLAFGMVCVFCELICISWIMAFACSSLYIIENGSLTLKLPKIAIGCGNHL